MFIAVAGVFDDGSEPLPEGYYLVPCLVFVKMIRPPQHEPPAYGAWEAGYAVCAGMMQGKS